ncbi:MAG: hypothetical protein LBG99_00045 [Propionibacteriaceae bacterium]|nr:hypothetical protein [Propionibacteriaceae bacterium]
MSRTELGDILGIGSSTTSQKLNGKVSWSFKDIYHVARISQFL